MAVLLAVIFAAIQTGPGKRMLALLGGTLASGNGLTVTISDIAGFVPANMKIGSVTLADPHGEFARIEGLRLTWNPLALFNATVAVETLEAGKVSLARKPDLPPAPENENSSSGTSLPLRIALDNLTVKEIDIAKPVIGQAATIGFTASARFMEPSRGLSLSFALERRDAEGVVKGTIGYVPNTQTLDIDVQAREPEAGLVARLANMDGLPAIDAAIKGSGPLDSWNGTLDIIAGEAARITGAATIRRQGRSYKAALDVDADVQHLLPANIAPLFEGVSKITAAALIDDRMRINIETFTIRAAGFGVGVAGTVDHAASTADLAFNVTGGDAVRFATLLPDAKWNNLRLEGTLRGAFAAPAVSMELTAQDFGAAGYGTKGLEVRAETIPDGKGGLAWKADGNLNGLQGHDAQTAAALGENGTFAFSGAVPANGAPSLTNANVSLVPLDLHFTGKAMADAVEGALRLSRLDLAALSPIAGRPLQGRVMLNADLNRGNAQHIIRARMNGASKEVATGIPAIDGLLGGNATLAGGVAYGAEGTVAVDELKLNASGLSLNVNGRIDRKIADLSTRASLPDLKRVDSRLEGRAEAEATFAGNLDSLAAKMRVTVPKGRAMGESIEGLTLHLDARDLTGRPGVDARLAGRIGGKSAIGTASFGAAGNNGAQHAFDLALGSVVAKGNVNASTEGLLDGQIALDARDLSDLSALALTELAGTAKANLNLTVKDGKQHIAVNASASKLRAAGITLMPPVWMSRPS